LTHPTASGAPFVAPTFVTAKVPAPLIASAVDAFAQLSDPPATRKLEPAGAG